MFWLDLLSSLPRLRLSDAQKKMVLLVMQETGSRDVPSLNTLKAMRAKLRKRCAPETLQSKSELGNIFYSNDIRSTIAMASLSACLIQ